jgi:hypothetical protein
MEPQQGYIIMSKQSDYEQGQKDGSQSTVMDQVGRSLGGDLLTSDEYNDGYDNGVENQPEDSNDSDDSDDNSSSSSWW